MKLSLPKLPALFSGKSASTQPQPTWREMLQLRPIRNPNLEWTEEEGRVVLLLLRGGRKDWKARLLKAFVPIPEKRRIALDAIGTDVWKMIDGENRLGLIAQKLARKYKLSPREAELSLQQFFKELGRRGYIGFLTEESEDKK